MRLERKEICRQKKERKEIKQRIRLGKSNTHGINYKLMCLKPINKQTRRSRKAFSFWKKRRRMRIRSPVLINWNILRMVRIFEKFPKSREGLRYICRIGKTQIFFLIIYNIYRIKCKFLKKKLGKLYLDR